MYQYSLNNNLKYIKILDLLLQILHKIQKCSIQAICNLII